MKFLWKLFYNVLIFPIAYFLAVILALFNQKIRNGLKGRLQSYTILKKEFPQRNRDRLVYWFHTASHGEFEQVRPILAGLKEIEPDCYCIVSFFSPSGYNNVQDEHIDCKIYLPSDFPWDCRRALRRTRPHKLIFAEYDIWPNLVWAAEKLNIPTTLFAARLQNKSTKNWPILRSFYRHVYGTIDSVYTVGEQDHIAVRRILPRKSRSIIRVLGNPRYDRVKEMADQFTIDRTKSVLLRQNGVIAGSVWPEDEMVILKPLVDMIKSSNELFLYWVPHEPKGKYVERTIRQLEELEINPVLLTDTRNSPREEEKFIIIDQVGILAELYWKGRIAYVGGGFSTGVHNVMEPAIARLPVIFGPKYHNSDAAEALLEAGGGFPVSNLEQFHNILTELMSDNEKFMQASLAATEVIHRNVGSATRVVRGIIRD
ncbi:MAG: 3-deoxy-D-manno-octulosonic acid transferase [Fidelibacterota bacterium]